jgi:hypothetical protein
MVIFRLFNALFIKYITPEVIPIDAMSTAMERRMHRVASGLS